MEPIDVPYVTLGKSIQSGDDLSTVDGIISNILVFWMKQRLYSHNIFLIFIGILFYIIQFFHFFY